MTTTPSGAATGPTDDAAVSSTSSFLGRRGELSVLLDSSPRDAAAPGRVVLVAGEPGIGKSRLAEEFAARVKETGIEVHWGRTWEASGAPPYWPWLQLIRSWLRTVDVEEVARRLGREATLVAQLLPELSDASGEVQPGEPDPEQARFRLFQAIATLLRDAAARRPLVLVLDDLHAADAPSLLLLQFLTADLADAAITFVALYRSTEVVPGLDLAATEAAVLRLPGATRLTLAGLAEQEVGLLLRSATGRAPPSGVIAAVHERTEGNPLFVGEIARLMDGAPGPSGTEAIGRAVIPSGIREAIARRLGRLPPPVVELLGVASILGRDVAIEALSRMTARSVVDLLEELEETIADGLLAIDPGGVGSLRFSHDLVRECLYQDLGPARRLRLHLAAGEVLEVLHEHDLDAHLAELAHHFFSAAPEGDLQRAVDYARRAGESALRTLAYEEAARMFGMALQLAESMPATGDGERGDLLLRRGDAEVRAGDLATARQSFRAAADLARRAQEPTALAEAALGYGGRFAWARAGADREIVRLLEDALAALGDVDSTLRVRLLGRLSGALRDEADLTRRDELSRQAVDMARRLGDDSTLAYALDARWGAIWSADRVHEQLALARDQVELAVRIGDRAEEAGGRLGEMVALWELGEIGDVRSAVDQLQSVVSEIREPAFRWTAALLTAALALQDGRFDEAEALARDAMAWGGASLLVDAEAAYVLHRYIIERERGRGAVLEETLRRAERSFTGYFHFAAVLAHLYAENGRPDDARALLRSCLTGRIAHRRSDNYWLLSLSLLAEVAATLAEHDAMVTIYDLMAPYADRFALGPPEASVGLVHRPLGVLAAALGRWDDATVHFERAVEGHGRAGTAPWLAWSQYQYATALIEHGGDGEHAGRLLDEAGRTAEALGMTMLAGRIAAEMARAGAQPAPPPEPREPPPATSAANVLRRTGDHWEVAFDGRTVRLRDMKGLQYLATLLAAPGREVPAIDLVTRVGGNRTDRGRVTDLAPAGGTPDDPVLDATAREAYAARLRELDEEVREAEEWSDTERAARAREEMDFLTTELTAATGLGGRDRQMTSDAERARQSVRKAISAAIARIGEHDAALAAHLTSTITTGYLCRYAPDPRAPVDWQV